MAIYQYGDFIPEIGENTWVFPSADIIGNVFLGKNVYIGAGAVLRGDYGRIIIEDGAVIEENVTIHASVNQSCHIHKNAIVGHAAMLHCCIIHEDVVIGMSSIVTNNAEIGKGSIIGEGALVIANTKIEEGQIAVGSPAKVIKPVPKHLTRFWKHVGAVYRQLALDYPKKLKKL